MVEFVPDVTHRKETQEALAVTSSRSEVGKEEARFSEADVAQLAVGIVEMLEGQAKVQRLWIGLSGADRPVRTVTDS